MDVGQSSLHSAHISSSNCHKEHLTKRRRVNDDIVSRVVRQDVDSAPQRNGINLIVVARQTSRLLDRARYRAMISMIILWRESEASDRCILEARPNPIIHNKIRNCEVGTLDPQLLRLSDGVVSDDARISNYGRALRVVGLVKRPCTFPVFAHEEVFECRILLRIRWLEIVHVDAVEVYEAFDFVARHGLAFFNPSFCVPAMHPQPHCVRRIDPFYDRVEEDDEFEFLEEGFLFVF